MTYPSASGPDAPVVPAYVNVYSVDKGAGLLEQTFVAVWMIVLFLPLDLFTPVRYLCIAGFLGILALDRRRLLPLALRAWPLFALPILGLISLGWSPFPSAIFRQAILLFLTPLVVVIIAGRLTPAQALRVMMFAGMVATLYVAPNPENAEIYGNKNYFALHMLFCMLLSLITLLNEKEPVWLRLLAAPFIPACFLFVVSSHSATALVFAVVGAAALIGIKYLWMPVTRIRGLSVLVMLFLAAILAIGALIIAVMPQNTLVAEFLELVGRDRTLTGRTALWEGARLAAQEKPLFGTGLGGFWYYDSGAAQTLNENDHKPFGTVLTFHNAYLEVQVHLGLVGLCLFVWFLIWTSVRMFVLWFRDGSLINSALVLLVAVNLAMSFTESSLWSTFTIPAFVQALVGIVAFRLHEPRFLGPGRLVALREDEAISGAGSPGGRS